MVLKVHARDRGGADPHLSSEASESPAAPLADTVSAVCSLQGGVKVLITGPWQEASNNYSCLFDQISVPASLIQPGVLRCYCPGEKAWGPGALDGVAWADPGRVMAWNWASISSAMEKWVPDGLL